ncbi:MAG: hypothetical protein ACRCWQ_09485, partial [Bacilli bacterium]
QFNPDYIDRKTGNPLPHINVYGDRYFFEELHGEFLWYGPTPPEYPSLGELDKGVLLENRYQRWGNPNVFCLVNGDNFNLKKGKVAPNSQTTYGNPKTCVDNK